MKIALIQCNTIPGDIVGNAEKILRAVNNAAGSRAGLCVTPELALCGVNPQNLLFSEGFIEGCTKTLQSMATKLKGGPAVLVGAPMPTGHGNTLTNAAVLLQNGTVSIISNKILNNDSPYFKSSTSCGLMTIAGWRLGVVLCDDTENDFWKMQNSNTQNPLMELISAGVDAIVHMASSPYCMNTQKKRENTYAHVAARHHIHFFSANMVGGNDGTVFSGQSLAFGPTGALLARGYAFEEDIVMLDTAVANETYIMATPSAEEEYWKALVLGTKDYVEKCGVKKVIVGISGGLDSAMVAAIAVHAFGPKNVYGLCLPSPYTSNESTEYAAALAKNLGFSLETIDISPLIQGFEGALAPSFEKHKASPNDLTFENIQARIRGTLLMALANRTQGMVLNTGNKSESAMGYCTLYGDAVGALGIIGDVSKTLLYSIADWYNKAFPKKPIPQGIIDRAPTAELRPNQKDSDSLPPYNELDAVMEQLLTVNKVAHQDAEKKALEERVLKGICLAEFKRRQCPPALQISPTALGKDWCIPMVNKIRLPH